MTGLATTHEHLIEVGIWRDPIVTRVGFDACGDYVELFWLPVIGPTATLLLRRLATTAVLHPEGCSLDAADLAISIGLGADIGPRSSLSRSIQRLSIFGLVKTTLWRSTDRRIDVRTVAPPLTLKHLSRLPEHLQIAHSLWSDSDPSDSYAAAYTTVTNERFTSSAS